MTTPPRPDFVAIFETLLKNDVDFIVIEGVCAVLHGAPVTTFDLDLVHSRETDNLARLESALLELGAFYRGHSSTRLMPTPTHLLSDGHHLLMTDAGPLDLLGTVGHKETYDSLLDRTTEVEVADKLVLHLLNLETLIELKEFAGREKDLAVLPILRGTLAEKLKT